jgi:hypothetical protein
MKDLLRQQSTVLVTGRVFDAIPAIDRAGPVVGSSVTWSILVLTLVLTDLGLAWQGVFTEPVTNCNDADYGTIMMRFAAKTSLAERGCELPTVTGLWLLSTMQ